MTHDDLLHYSKAVELRFRRAQQHTTNDETTIMQKKLWPRYDVWSNSHYPSETGISSK